MGREYALVDAGEGGRLERFGGVLVARPAPTATASRRAGDAWEAADAVFAASPGEDGPGRWTLRAPLPDPWLVAVGGLELALAPTESGQLGLFPEHVTAWSWVQARVTERLAGGPVTVLHLFAYTGGATLAAAAAGANVVHVDASRPTVAWARRNADRSGLADRPVRWIVEDAAAFTRREVRRGRRYDVVVLDPPTWGHGPSGRAWRLHEGLASLLADCVGVLAPDGAVLLTVHTAGLGAAMLAERLEEAARTVARPGPGADPPVVAGDLALPADSGATLPLGSWAVLGGPPLAAGG